VLGERRARLRLSLHRFLGMTVDYADEHARTERIRIGGARRVELLDVDLS
jgi:hypothetical protein